MRTIRRPTLAEGTAALILAVIVIGVGIGRATDRGVMALFQDVSALRAEELRMTNYLEALEVGAPDVSNADPLLRIVATENVDFIVAFESRRRLGVRDAQVSRLASLALLRRGIRAEAFGEKQMCYVWASEILDSVRDAQQRVLPDNVTRCSRKLAEHASSVWARFDWNGAATLPRLTVYFRVVDGRGDDQVKNTITGQLEKLRHVSPIRHSVARYLSRI